uniref:Cell cycle checkpoint control protein RAD9A n=1 Tax=Panagrolaimus superbus TaxID=310955 RepID=A0A914Z9J3_9BILA
MTQESECQRFHGSPNETQTQTIPAHYVFNEKVEIFADTVKFIAKFSDSLMVEFGDGSLYIEALTATKSAQANALFEGNSIAEWSYGDLGTIVDKRIQLSTKQFVGALRSVTKHDTLYFKIKGVSCNRVAIEYTNNRDVVRQFELQARDVSLTYNKLKCPRHQYSNKIVCSTKFFKVLFAQLNETDEMCLQFYPDHSVITKFINETNADNVATLHSTQSRDSYELYEIAVPMSLVLSVRELKVALKLINVHSFLVHIFFGLGGKPLLVTFDDENKDEKCKALISIAEVHELTEEDEYEPIQNNSMSIAEVRDVNDQNDQGRLVERNFNSNDEIREINGENDHAELVERSFNSYDEMREINDKDEYEIVKRNSTSPYAAALRLLGIEDQISDPEAEDVLETYNLPATDPSEDLYILSQMPER